MAEDTKKLEELAYQYQLLQAQAQLLAQNLELLTLGRNEFQAVKETLEGLKNEEGEFEILVPIGAGSFLKGKIVDAKNAIVSVGAGYAVQKSLDDSIEYLEKRIKEYEEAIAKTQEALKKLEAQLGELARQAQEIQQKQAMGFSVKK
ncbi:prefoldin, alpha subunit [Thermococcus kodakarensis KOD1]|uniref:Prefoldin subunit alpha 1 n=1 Tax=Thermococcus kodakarensis (strain ATCC BAA-918 / JCM 12380 / KOD1) TaxID=69014 RepID=PFDA1_THEKO|nr:prefoldin subunit alpha [Thermococcus kodakarensis]Q5JIE3.1 RecName: Full=Prefoldin subunit alpha 1; AltName: Full=GimC subunit alpha 1 [Thermococcus kodakarensis KOD1]WCN29263.1 prefoldin subunit alpha [Thermococcus kodakarensis]WCN31558.1 prefoldin subunit alpha [Thermococcus kodakarensis]BAD85194.1 prefoldin, alpha subunit [Thermococcus kodakarensis KOD1]